MRRLFLSVFVLTGIAAANPLTASFVDLMNPMAFFVTPQSVGNLGQMAGFYLDFQGNYHGFIVTGGRFTTGDADAMSTGYTIPRWINSQALAYLFNRLGNRPFLNSGAAVSAGDYY